MTSALAQPITVLVIGFVALVIVLLGRNLSLKIGNIHAELRPNGGTTLRDAVDRVELAAKVAVVRAEQAADQATVAAAQAAMTLDRLERAYPQHVQLDIHHEDGTTHIEGDISAAVHP